MNKKEVRNQILDCSRCELSNKSSVVPVPWRGPVPSKIVIVGEAPGAQENIEGKPFIGASGILLSEALRRAQLNEKKICIMNTVCCFPAGSPEVWHIEACKKNLKAQFNIAKPRYVLLLGNVALQALHPGANGITIERGKFWVSKAGRLMFPAYHPAFVFRGGKERRSIFFNDIADFADLTRKPVRVS